MDGQRHRVIGFAHRGARSECPDNTMVSFRRAIELGADALESDVWRTADGVAVLDHDGRVRRGVRRTPISSLRRRDLPSHIPALHELYDGCGSDFELSLDVKDPAAASAAVDAADAVGATGRLWLCGSGPSLAAWRGLSPVVRLVESTRRAAMPDPRAHAAALRSSDVDAVNLRWGDWDAPTLDAVHAAGLVAFTWGVQRSADLVAAIALGVDGLYSDHVDRMVAAIRP